MDSCIPSVWVKFLAFFFEIVQEDSVSVLGTFENTSFSLVLNGA